MEKNRQTVRVSDEQGTVIGYTYPKRAKGLVRKCRAEFVSDYEIRLNKQCPTYENMEDKKMDQNNITDNNFITVNPKEWGKNPSTNRETVFDRFVISNPFAGVLESAAGMVEVFSLGQWEWRDASCVVSGFWELEPEKEYHFVFWLNGGENDRSDETCQLQILFTDSSITASKEEFMEGLCYRLNRGYIKPCKKYKGWELYDVSFTTTQARYVQCQFVAERAPMAVMPAEQLEVYKELPDIPDPYEDRRPQRHNIVFEDGWPVDQWYGTKNLENTENYQGNKPSSVRGKMPGKTPDVVTNVLEGLPDEITSRIADSLEGLPDEIMDGIMESIRTSFYPDHK